MPLEYFLLIDGKATLIKDSVKYYKDKVCKIFEKQKTKSNNAYHKNLKKGPKEENSKDGSARGGGVSGG